MHFIGKDELSSFLIRFDVQFEHMVPDKTGASKPLVENDLLILVGIYAIVLPDEHRSY